MNAIGIVGRKDAGKTTLVERLVTHFSAGGLDVATLKHAHSGFEVDTPGTDSYRHRAAGARRVIVASARRVAMIEELSGRPVPALPDLLHGLRDADLVLVEGWKGSDLRKVEVHRTTITEEPIAVSDPSVIAVASDGAPDVPCPVLPVDDIPAIAALIAREVGV